MIIYVGGYSDNNALYEVEFNTTSNYFLKPQVIKDLADVKYISCKESCLALIAKAEKSGIAYFDFKNTEYLTNFNEDSASCFIEQDNDYIYTANYHSGEIIVYEKKQNYQSLRGLLPVINQGLIKHIVTEIIYLSLV